MLASKEIDLHANATHGEIEKKLSVMGANLLIENLKKLEKNDVKFDDQEDSEATYAKK